MKRLNLISSKRVFIATIIIIPTLVLIVYLTGLESHRSLYLNSIIVTTLIGFIFFCFITIGLYNGWKLKDTLGNFKKYLSKYPDPSNVSMDISGADLPGDDIAGAIISLVLWIVIALFGSLILWFFGAFFWGVILVLAGLLYWIFFRALRLIFRNSAKCKGDLANSMLIAVVYSILYTFWIYIIIFLTHFYRSNI